MTQPLEQAQFFVLKIVLAEAVSADTAQNAAVSILLSEDFQHERILGRVRIVNPLIPNDYWSAF